MIAQQSFNWWWFLAVSFQFVASDLFSVAMRLLACLSKERQPSTHHQRGVDYILLP